MKKHLAVIIEEEMCWGYISGMNGKKKKNSLNFFQIPSSRNTNRNKFGKGGLRVI